MELPATEHNPMMRGVGMLRMLSTGQALGMRHLNQMTCFNLYNINDAWKLIQCPTDRPAKNLWVKCSIGSPLYLRWVTAWWCTVWFNRHLFLCQRRINIGMKVPGDTSRQDTSTYLPTPMFLHNHTLFVSVSSLFWDTRHLRVFYAWIVKMALMPSKEINFDPHHS